MVQARKVLASVLLPVQLLPSNTKVWPRDNQGTSAAAVAGWRTSRASAAIPSGNAARAGSSGRGCCVGATVLALLSTSTAATPVNWASIR